MLKSRSPHQIVEQVTDRRPTCSMPRGRSRVCRRCQRSRCDPHLLIGHVGAEPAHGPSCRLRPRNELRIDESGRLGHALGRDLRSSFSAKCRDFVSKTASAATQSRDAGFFARLVLAQETIGIDTVEVAHCRSSAAGFCHEQNHSAVGERDVRANRQGAPKIIHPRRRRFLRWRRAPGHITASPPAAAAATPSPTTTPATSSAAPARAPGAPTIPATTRASPRRSSRS